MKQKILLLAAILFAWSWSARAQTFSAVYQFGASSGANPQTPNGNLVQSGNTLYGTTQSGGPNSQGVVFAVNTNGSDYTNVLTFYGNNGANPQAGLVLSGNTLYGTTPQGDAQGQGNVFAVNTDGSGFTDLHAFSGPDGANPQAALVLSSNTLYGTAPNGGAGSGTIFAVNTDGSGFTRLHSFDGNHWRDPQAGLVSCGDKLYGTSSGGGPENMGTVFVIDTNGISRVLYGFTNGIDGANPDASLVLSGHRLYGTAENGGVAGAGTVFAVNTDGSDFTNLYGFMNDGDGDNPEAGLILSSNTLYGTTFGGGLYGNGAVFAVNTDGSDFTTLYSFMNSGDGANPQAGLVLSGKTLYGTTANGCDAASGCVFAVNTDGSDYTNLYSFMNGGDGAYPQAGLVLSGNTLYGTTVAGDGNGCVFAINTDGSGYHYVHSFLYYADGANPAAGLVLSGNTLYGTTQYGGANIFDGTVFAVNTDGSNFTTLYDFGSDGSRSPVGTLFLQGNTLYGTTQSGDNGYGCVFGINTDGSDFTNLSLIFNNQIDGMSPNAGLVLSGNVLYGTAAAGGADEQGTVFAIRTDGCGYTNLYNFTGGNDGAGPVAGLVLSGNTLYGTTLNGGANGQGAIFAINTDGSDFTNLYAFTGGNDGANPMGGLLLCSNLLYGTASEGGTNGVGAVFAINADGSDFNSFYSFNNAGDGANPEGALLICGNTLYGTSADAGENGVGTLFSFTLAAPTPQPLTAAPETVYRGAGMPLQISLANLATNWTDPNGVPALFGSVNPESTNGVSVTSDANFIYYTNNANVDDQLSYNITDSLNAAGTGIINIVVVANPGGLINIAGPGGGGVTLNLTGVPGYSYSVERSTNLTTGDWVVLSETNAPGNGLFHLIDPNPPKPQAFYRLEMQ